MTATIARPRQPHSDWLARLRTIGMGLGGRGVIGWGAGRSAVSAAAPWFRASGAPLPVAVYQPLGAASLDASYINLVNPGTYNAAPGVAPTFGANGWTFDGSTQYLSTGYVLADGFSMIARFSGVANTGSVAGQEWQFIIPKWIGDPTYHDFRYGSTQAFSAPNVTAGVMALTSGYGYIDGALIDTFSPVSNWHATDVAYIGARSLDGAATNFFAGNVQAIAIYSDILTAGEVATLSAAMAAL